MRFFTFQNLALVLCIFLTVIFVFACSTSKMQTTEPTVQAPQNQEQTVEPRPCATEPTDMASYNKNVQAAWKKFTANGQYQLDCNNYVYNWGSWGYPKRELEDHLAAVVVDTTRTDANRYSLVIFSPPRAKKNVYEVHWLYKDRDLSKTSVGMSSGSVWVEDRSNEGKKSLCWIFWDSAERNFICAGTSQ